MKLPKIDLLYLSMIAFVFVSSFFLSLAKQDFAIVEEIVKAKAKSEEYPPRPVLKAVHSDLSALSAYAVIVVDMDSGVILYDKNPDEKLLPASTTKIVTALTALGAYDPNQLINVQNLSVVGQKMGLVEGEQISIRSLLYGLLVYSANDAAEALAQNYCNSEGSCGRDIFIEAMNQKAHELNLANTHFTNPSGLDAEDHYSTARDLARASGEAMENLLFAKIVGTKEIGVASSDGKITHKLVNINELLGVVPGVLGVKTGWTQSARENLVTYIKRDDKKLMLVILGSQDRFGETRALIDWIFGNYEWEDVAYNTND
jgi:D-alanyl-D-alanine carboxypeptidase (penicillin-binding protein 5/6)